VQTVLYTHIYTLSSLSLTQWSVILLLSVLDDLYATIDADGDGVLSKPEFAKMYTLMKAKMNTEQKAAEEEHAKLTKSQRRSRLLCAGIGMAVPIMLILLLGNMGLVYSMLEMTKETHTKNGQMEDRSGHVVQTGSSYTEMSLIGLPLSGDATEYDRLLSIVVADSREAAVDEENIPTRSFAIASWSRKRAEHRRLASRCRTSQSRNATTFRPLLPLAGRRKHDPHDLHWG